MTQVTRAGALLADRVWEKVGWTRGILETCSRLARDARTYSLVQEQWCNREMTEQEVEILQAHEARLEERILSRVESLPQPDEGRWVVEFRGDPRASTVVLSVEGTEWQVALDA
jgi:hypothetical protein